MFLKDAKKGVGVVAVWRWLVGAKEIDISVLNVRVVVCYLAVLMKVLSNPMNLFGFLNGY